MTETILAIETTGLTKTIGGRTVLRNLNLRVPETECLAVMGANGSGKTTLLRCLCGASRPTSGGVSWYGNGQRGNPQVCRLIGYVAHEPQAYRQLTVRENLLFAACMADVREPKRRTDEMLETSGLGLLADHRPFQISRGMRQRLSISRSILHDPKILLLDEPFAGLDETSREWLIDLIRGLGARGKTVFFATHREGLAQRLAQRVICLQAGQIQEGGPERSRFARQLAA